MKPPAELTGVILAAGRGSRLGSETAQKPKCFVEVNGRSLLDWQISALGAAGIERVIVVTGYQGQLIDQTGIDTVYSSRWADTNMVSSLVLAMKQVEPPYIVSYSDIVYSERHVRTLLETPGDLVLTYDRRWRELWNLRFEDPTSDAESFKIRPDGRVVEIGKPLERIEDTEGQFMGLMKINAQARKWIVQLAESEPNIDTMDTTTMLQRLIDTDKPVFGAPISGGWAEVDDAHDRRVAESLVNQGEIQRPKDFQ